MLRAPREGAMASQFWRSDQQFARLKPLLPTDVKGVPRVDDRRVICGIVHVLRSGCRWCDVPACYEPRTTLYNRFVRWAERGIGNDLFKALAQEGGAPATLMLDATSAKAHRCAAGGKGGRTPRPIGRSRGGRTTKIPMAVDGAGRPRRLIVRPGHRGDAPVAAEWPPTSSAPSLRAGASPMGPTTPRLPTPRPCARWSAIAVACRSSPTTRQGGRNTPSIRCSTANATSLNDHSAD